MPLAPPTTPAVPAQAPQTAPQAAVPSSRPVRRSWPSWLTVPVGMRKLVGLVLVLPAIVSVAFLERVGVSLPTIQNTQSVVVLAYGVFCLSNALKGPDGPGEAPSGVLALLSTLLPRPAAPSSGTPSTPPRE